MIKTEHNINNTNELLRLCKFLVQAALLLSDRPQGLRATRWRTSWSGECWRSTGRFKVASFNKRKEEMCHVNQVYRDGPGVISKWTEFDTVHSGRRDLGELLTAQRRRSKMPLIRLQQPNQPKRELERSKGRVTPLVCVLRSELTETGRRIERARVVSTLVLPHADTYIRMSTNKSPSE